MPQDNKGQGEISRRHLLQLTAVAGLVLGTTGRISAEEDDKPWAPKDHDHSGQKGSTDRLGVAAPVKSINTERIDNIADHIVDSASDWEELPSVVSAGETVWVGPVQFETGTTWEMPDNTTLRGAGRGTKITQEANADSVLVQAGTGCTIQDITLDGNFAEQSNGGVTSIQPGAEEVVYLNVHALDGWRTCFSGRNCKDITYIGCLAQGAGDDNFAWGPGAENITAIACTSRETRGQVSTLSSGFEIDDGAKDVLLSGIITYNNYGFGVDIHDHDGKEGSKNVTVTGHLSVGDGRGGFKFSGSDGSLSRTENGQYSDFMIVDCDRVAIEITGDAKRVSVSSGTIFNAQSGRAIHVRTAPGPRDVSIRDVSIFRGPGAGAANRPVDIEAGNGVVLDSLHIDGAGRDGIRVQDGTSNVQVKNCDLVDCFIGINVQSPDTIVSNCFITSEERAGISITAPRSRVADCYIDGLSELTTGINVSGGADQSQVKDTTVVDCVFNNIDLGTAQDVEIHDCQIGTTDGSTTNGVRTRGSADGLRVTGCHFYGPLNEINTDSADDVTIRFNRGYQTEDRGTATIPSDSTTVNVSHGIDPNPPVEAFSVTPMNDLGNATKFWIEDTFSGSFTIAVDQAPGADEADFTWQIESVDR